MMAICTIDGCEKRHFGKGFCSMHYARFRRHGDPLFAKVIQAAPGEPAAFYREVVLNYEGDDCLIWPYARFRGGYGRIHGDGRTEVVSRRVCEDINGPPPQPEYEAAHSCGNGHLGCVSRMHLSWKTKAGNQADRLDHGTDSRGSRHGKSKLSEEQAKEIIARRGFETQSSIAKRFGVSQQAIDKIQTGKTWSWLER